MDVWVFLVPSLIFSFLRPQPFVGSFSLSKLPYKPFKGIGTRRQTAEKEELAASTAAKIRYQMGERDLNGAIRHLLACDEDKKELDGGVGRPHTLKRRKANCYLGEVAKNRFQS